MHNYFLRRNRRNNQETPTIQNLNMTENIQTIDVYNALKIPDAIKDLPKFNGNPRLLFEFITNVEEILSILQQIENTPTNKIYLRAIRNKIEGDANEVLNMYGTALNWDEIKTNLILHYSDKRTETSLIRDLHKLQQNKQTVEQFYSEVIELQSTLMNNAKIHESDQNVISSKKELFSEMCLTTFLSGLKEPLGSNIRASKPKTLAEAFNFCIKEQNIFYSRFNPYSKPSYIQNSTFPQNRQLNNNFKKNFQQTSSEHPFQQNDHQLSKFQYKNPNFSKTNGYTYSNFQNKNQNGNQKFRPKYFNKESNNVSKRCAREPYSKP